MTGAEAYWNVNIVNNLPSVSFCLFPPHALTLLYKEHLMKKDKRCIKKGKLSLTMHEEAKWVAQFFNCNMDEGLGGVGTATFPEL